MASSCLSTISGWCDMASMTDIADDFMRGYLQEAASDFLGVLETNPALSESQAEDVLELIRNADVVINFEGEA